jgi:hypothetical protein
MASEVKTVSQISMSNISCIIAENVADFSFPISSTQITQNCMGAIKADSQARVAHRHLLVPWCAISLN